MKGICSLYSVSVWQKTYSELLPIVQNKWGDLHALYSQQYKNGGVLFDNEMDFSEFNLRHSRHPETNASETNAMDYVYRHWPYVTNVEIATSKEDQTHGCDLIVHHNILLEPNTHYMHKISVKMADMSELSPGGEPMRSMSVHEEVKNKIMSDQSHGIMLVDNKCGRVFFRSAQDMKQLMKQTFTKGNHRGIFYDIIGGTRNEITQPIR